MLFRSRRTRQGILREQEVSNFEPKLKFPQEKLQARSYSFADDLSNIIIQKTTNSNLGSINKLNINEIIKKIYLLKELYTEYDEAKKDYIEKTIDNDLNLLIHPIDQLDNFTQLHSETYLATSSPLRLVYQIIQFLGFIPYRYMIYHQNFYGKDTADLQSLPQTPANKVLNRQKGIYGLLRIVFLKRLESSFYALKRSLANYRNNLERFKYALNNGIIQPISKIKKLFDEYTDNDDYNINFINKDTELTEEFNFAEFNHEIMQVDIEKELKLLDILDIQLELLERHDNKIKDLAELFKDIQTNHLEYNNGKPKILVFSYFLDTIKYLEENFKNYYHYNENECAFINSSNRNNIDGLTRRFAPKAKDYQLKPGEQELRFLFATDVLSEGQNLQDCAILINYDLHWNPVRMIQRNGRINRIGSENDTVLIYNMYPNSQLEEYLKLVKRLDYKIGLIRDIVGQDQRILNSDENLNFIEFVDDIEITKLQDLYSDNEEKANKILTELEDDAEYLTDDKFIADLRYFDNKYKHNPKYKEEIYSIPRGKFGLLKDNKKPEQLLMFTQINDAYNNKLFNKFFMIDLSKNKPTSKGIDDLTALQLICTDENNNQRQISKTYTRYISCLTKEFLQTHIETLQSSNNNTHRDLDTKMIKLREKFLHLLVEIGYSEEERNTFDRALLYSNHLDFEIIIKHIRKILKKPTTNEIDELLEICKKSIIGLDEEKKVIQPAICEGILYYGN